MKPVLILFDSDKGSMTAPQYYTNHSPTAICMNILEVLSIPFEIGWTGTKSVDDAGDYSLVIIPFMNWQRDNLGPWAGGAVGAPVFVASAASVLNGAGFTSGATVREYTAAEASLNSQWGSVGYPTGTVIYTLDAGDANVTNLIYEDGGRSAFWKRRGSGGHDVYFWGEPNYPAFPLCHVLAQVYTAEEVLFPLYVDVDHPDDCVEIANLTAFIAWLRARNAVSAAGITQCATAAEWNALDDVTKTLLINNQDVLIPQIHSHTSGHRLWSEEAGEDLGTVEKKVAEYRAQQAILVAAGLNVADNGSLGYHFMPWNKVTLLGMEAMATLGIKVCRGVPYGYSYFPVPNTPRIPFRLDDGSVVPVWSRMDLEACSFDATTLAQEYAAHGATDIHGYRRRHQHRDIGRVIQYNTAIFCLHGVPFGGENPAQMFLDVFDVFVQAASPIVRWATREDLANMASIGKRKSSYR
ncbi:MAG TPA: hypothetical protein VM118_03320 [Acidobacteriota bacterium]|nr:hypothetical protein [Acidobacteriota bacterium]